MAKRPPDPRAGAFPLGLLKALFADLIFGSFKDEDKAINTLNRVVPPLYVVVFATAVAGFAVEEGTIKLAYGGLLALVAGLIVHWRKSPVAAVVVLLYILYLPFALADQLTGPVDIVGSLIVYVAILICAYLAFRAAWGYQQFRREERRQMTEVLAAHRDRAEPTKPQRGFTAFLDRERRIKGDRAADDQ